MDNIFSKTLKKSSTPLDSSPIVWYYSIVNNDRAFIRFILAMYSYPYESCVKMNGIGNGYVVKKAKLWYAPQCKPEWEIGQGGKAWDRNPSVPSRPIFEKGICGCSVGATR